MNNRFMALVVPFLHGDLRPFRPDRGRSRSLNITMSTRKLILTALICGLAIMLAGGFKLFQVATDDVEAVVFDFGTEQTLGDMVVTVTSVKQSADQTLVSVRMRGVADADGYEGWKLLADGKLSSPVVTADTPPCVTTVAQFVECSVPFVGSTGSSLTVAYQRANLQSQWAP